MPTLPLAPLPSSIIDRIPCRGNQIRTSAGNHRHGRMNIPVGCRRNDTGIDNAQIQRPTDQQIFIHHRFGVGSHACGAYPMRIWQDRILDPHWQVGLDTRRKFRTDLIGQG
eukprot:scaffold37_cov159-Amphora_coffeaeformis.AAC.9